MDTPVGESREGSVPAQPRARMTKAELLAELATYDDRINDMATTIADQQNEIGRLQGEVDRLQAEAGDLNQAIADMVVQSRTTDRHTSVASQTTNPDTSHKRSSKVPNPPVWNNEPDRDTQEFEH